MTNKEKMLKGLPYDGFDESLAQERDCTWLLLQKYNNTPVNETSKLDFLIKRILGSTGKKIRIKPPFFCDYGYNIHVGENFFANYNLTVLDTGKITIGNHVLLGPNVSVFAASHPIDSKIRISGIEFSAEIRIGNNVWIGGNTVINPGVKIGDNTVIGSGSVVTKNIPPNVVAAGNPCRVLRKIEIRDSLYYFHTKKY